MDKGTSPRNSSGTCREMLAREGAVQKCQQRGEELSCQGIAHEHDVEAAPGGERAELLRGEVREHALGPGWLPSVLHAAPHGVRRRPNAALPPEPQGGGGRVVPSTDERVAVAALQAIPRW